MKRIVCLCIMAALCLCFLLPEKALAVATSGTCGKNTQWYYDEETATLHISGQGPMAFADDPTWSGLADQVQRVVIEEGITSISRNAFKDFSVLWDVQIAQSVTLIENNAFEKCINLKTIDLHDGIQDIWGACFLKSGLTEITIPKSIKVIRISTFSGCEQLKTVVLHDEITEIESIAFQWCKSLEEITIPDRVTVIANSAFQDCSNLRKVDLGKGIVSIEMYAFGHCSSLEELVFPKNLDEIQNSAFIGCKKLNKLTFQGAATNISDVAFEEVSATILYPAFLDAWEGRCLNYGGTLTWKAYDCTEHIVQVDPEKIPTCTENGLTAGTHCTRCDAVLQAQETITATGHTYGEWKIVDSSMEEGVWVEHTCEACGYVEQKLTQPIYPNNPQATDPQSTDPDETNPQPTDPEETDTQPTDPTGSIQETTTPTQPTEAPDEPTLPNVTTTEEPKSFPWGTVIVGILIIAACGVTGFWFGKKRK